MAPPSHQTPLTPQTTAEAVPQSPLNSPARPINPPEQWYAPTSLVEHRRRNRSRSSSSSAVGNASAAPPRQPRQSASIEATPPKASRLVEAKAATVNATGSTSAQPSSSSTTDGLRDGAAEAYWRACASELGPGEAWYAQAASGRENGGERGERGEKEGSVEQSRSLMAVEHGGGREGKRWGEADDEDEEKGGTREFGPGVEWYQGMGSANPVMVSCDEGRTWWRLRPDA